MVPSPCGFDDFVGTVDILNVERPNLVEASELAGTSGPALKPDDKGDVVILPGEVGALP